MKNLILIENAKELFDFADRSNKSEGDSTPRLPLEATLVFENNMDYVQLQKADGFILSNEVNATEILAEAIRRGGLSIHIT